MAPLVLEEMEKRQNYYSCPSGYSYSNGYCYSPWDLYGRWVLLAAVIVGAFLLFCVFSCITARRRRRIGQQPFRGTGWAAGPPPYQGQGYNGQQNYGGPQGNTWQQPPPQYNTQDNSHFGKNQNQGYAQPGYGQQSGSVELQSPGHSYQRGGENVYSPPAGPPPGKGDGIVR